MQSHKPNGASQSADRDELFNFTAGEDGPVKPCRALSDEELRSYLADVMAQHQHAVEQVNDALSDLTNAARFMAALEFEIERRAKSSSIKRILPGVVRLLD